MTRPLFHSCLLGLLISGAGFDTLAQDGVPQLEQIIVTAEKRSESLQDLSQAVTALSDTDLDQRHIITFTDLGSIAPGVTVAKNEGFNTVVSIRGVGNEANQNSIASPSVSYHQDGVYMASPYALRTDFLDLERIEVLRGPQGTLFGQNSTGGALNVLTRAPDTSGFSGKADVTLGNYNLVRTRGTVNIPVNDNMALRAAVASHNHDGFSRNIVRAQALDQADSIAGRVRLQWTPTQQLRLNFTAQYYDENTNGAASKGLLDPTPGARRLAQDWYGVFEQENELYSLIVEWDLPAFTMRSLSSYQDDDIYVWRDNDRNDLPTLLNAGSFILPAAFEQHNRQQTFTQELNLISDTPLFGRLDWVAGVFYLNTEVDIFIREYIDFNTDGIYGPGTVTVEEVLNFGGEVGFISDSRPERDSVSVYRQGTLHLSDRLRLVAGLRYTEDETYSAVTNFFGRAGTAILETGSSRLSWRGALEYDLNIDTMIYGSYTRGFKPGSNNLTYGREDIVAPVLVLPSYADETVEAWELGVKTDFADNRARLNAALFYYDYVNLQYQATDPEVFQGGVGNLPKSEIYGAEAELLAWLGDSLTLDARLAWTETKVSAAHLALDNVRSDEVTNALLPQCNFNIFCDDIQRARAAAILDVNGNELAKTPDFTADAMLRYQLRAGRWGNLEASAHYIYRGGFYHRLFNNPKTDSVPDYHVVNLGLSFTPDAWPWRVDLLAMNVTDEDGVNARFTDVFGVGATGDELIAPRQYMARLSLEF